jgi:LuxR family maltose regulon positive regulatory protein
MIKAEMAERMTDHPRAAALLHSLLQGNYFLSRTDAPDPLYRYHQLFRLFLLHHTGTVWGAEEQAECRRQAAAILEEEGQLDAAAALWREAGDWDALVSLIRRAAPLRLAQGLTQGLDTWMEGVPSLAAAERPWLLYWLGRARLHPDPIAARSLFEQAYRGFKQAQDIEGGLLSWAGVCETYWIALDGTDPLTRWLAELEDLQSQWQQFPSPEIEARVSFGAFFAVIANDPLHPRRSLWEKRLLSALDSTLPPDLRLMVANLLMFHYVWTMGDRGRAALVLDRLRVLAGNDATAPLSVIIARTWGDFAYEYCFGGQMERCRTIAKGAMAVAAERGAHLYDAILWAIPACAYLTTAQFAKAQPYLSKILGTVDAARLFDRGLFFYLRAWEAWLDDRLAEAREAAETSLAYAGRFGDLHGYWHTKLALAQIEQTSGNTRRALRHLAAVRHWARRVGSALAVFTGALVLARLALESERPERCRRLLRIAFGLGRQQGYVSILFFEPETLARLCAHALDAGMDVDYTRLLIRQRDLAPPREALVSEWWPWPIKIATLGGLALWVNEDAIRWPRKAQHKPLDLLRAVIAYGGRRVPSEKLIDELWPEAEGDAATRALKTTLHRVRKLLGREDAVQLRDGQVSLNPACVWLDRWALEQVLEDTRLAASRPPRVGMLEAIEKTSQARMALT